MFSTFNLNNTMPPRAAVIAIMTFGEAADYLKVTERTIYRLAGAKQIPTFKVGESWRFSKADIDRWIQEQSFDGYRPSSARD